jgi:dipeptidyl aminopeptidase/acylaminoacyl peptidase
MSQGQAEVDPKIEAVNFVRAGAPPMLLVHGMKDDVIEPRNTPALADRLRAAGGEVGTVYYKDRGHVDVVLAFAWPLRWMAPVLDDTTRFFDRH